MLTASIETQQIFNGIVQFISYMVLAVFAENVVLARALGVTRLIKLVPDHRAQVWDFGLPLLFVMVLSAPLGWAAHNRLFPWLRDYLPDWLPISALPQPVEPGDLQHCHPGHAAHLLQPELHDFTEHRVCAGQRHRLRVRRLCRARRPPPSAQQSDFLDFPGPAQFHDLHWRAEPGHLRPGGPYRRFVMSVPCRGGHCPPAGRLPGLWAAAGSDGRAMLAPTVPYRASSFSGTRRRWSSCRCSRRWGPARSWDRRRS